MNVSYRKIKNFFYGVLEYKSYSLFGKFLEKLLLGLILLNVLLSILETVEFLEPYKHIIIEIERISLWIFLVEYFFRLWVADLDGTTRLKTMLGPLMILDAAVLILWGLEAIGLLVFNPQALRAFRIVRISRLFRMGKYTMAMEHIKNLLIHHKADFIMILQLMIGWLIISSTVLFFVENNTNPAFTSIPETMYFSLVTFATVGFGDITAITPIGKFITMINILIGGFIYALPTAILGASFYAEIQKKSGQKVQNLEKEISILKNKLHHISPQKRMEKQRELKKTSSLAGQQKPVKKEPKSLLFKKINAAKNFFRKPK